MLASLPSFTGLAIALYLLAILGLISLFGWISKALGLRARVTTGTE